VWANLARRIGGTYPAAIAADAFVLRKADDDGSAGLQHCTITIPKLDDFT
jgi:hypothetical protein